MVAQVAISLVLLIGAGLFLRSLSEAHTIDVGFEKDRVAILSPAVMFAGMKGTEGEEYYARVLEAARSVPGVQAAALTNRLPLGAEIRTHSLQPAEHSTPWDDAPEHHVATVDGNYFSVMGIPLLYGRTFGEHDLASAPAVVVISEAAAHRWWPEQNALGQRLRIGENRWAEVVGIARDTKVATLGEAPRPYVYYPFSQDYDPSTKLIVRTAGPAELLLEDLKQKVKGVQANVPIFELKSMTQHLGLMLYPPRAGAVLLSLCGMLGLILASLGLYGVVAYSVARRTREIGIRMALGAQRGNVLALVVREGMSLVVAGVIVGLGLALLLTQPLSMLLYGVQPVDPATFTVVSLVLLLVALTANFVPAWRATRIDPMEALRYD